MKIIFLFFKNNYRKKTLVNFVKTRIYGKKIIVNLSGKLNYYLFFFLIKFFKLGKILSIEGNPSVTKKEGINFWLTGTHIKILEKYKYFQNNYVNMTNPIFTNNEKIFQIYPIISSKWNLMKNIKIIYMGKFYFYNRDSEDKDDYILELLSNNYSEIDNKNFWLRNFSYLTEIETFEKYRILKNFIREKILENIDNNFGKYFEVYLEGSPKIKFAHSKLCSPNYKLKEVCNIYNGNFCLDTGSIMGSNSIYPRSIQILESSGFILQNIQTDSSDAWGELEKFITFASKKNLNDLIEKYLSNLSFREEIYCSLRDFNKNNIKKIEKSLNKAFD
jgi:hypothetical protein